MKFVILVEAEGYELRYWDEINEEIRDSVITCWDKNKFYDKLIEMNFNIDKKTLERALSLIENGKPFVILSSINDPNNLDTFHRDKFIIEE